MIVFSANFFQPFFSKVIDTMPLSLDHYSDKLNFLLDIYTNCRLLFLLASSCRAFVTSCSNFLFKYNDSIQNQTQL
jgi:hypothetical protein